MAFASPPPKRAPPPKPGTLGRANGESKPNSPPPPKQPSLIPPEPPVMMHFQPSSSLMTTLERNFKKSSLERIQARCPTLRRSSMAFSPTSKRVDQSFPVPDALPRSVSDSTSFRSHLLQKADPCDSLRPNSHPSPATLPRSPQKSPSFNSSSLPRSTPQGRDSHASSLPRSAHKEREDPGRAIRTVADQSQELTKLPSDLESVRSQTPRASRSPASNRGSPPYNSPNRDTPSRQINGSERLKLDEEWDRLRQWEEALTRKDTDLAQILEEVMAEISSREAEVENRERDVSQERQRLQCWSDDLRMKEEDLHGRETSLYRREEELERKERHLAKYLDSFIDNS